MTQHRLPHKEPHLASLIVLCAFAAMGAVLITPALPQIATFFQIQASTAKLTVTSFLLGYALGQLIYGPIANRIGRKPAFYIGIGIASLGSIFSILSAPAHSFSLLILGRFLEAIGASCGLIVCFTIINDYYFPEQARVRVGLMMLAFSIVPGVAIMAGGFITQNMGWETCFYFLLLYGFVLIIPAIRMPETLTEPDYKALHHKHLAKNYWAMFTNKQLMAYSMMYGFSCSCVYLFGAEGPFIGIQYLHKSAGDYGLLGLIPFTGAFLGSIATVMLAKKISARKMIAICFSMQVFAALFMLLAFSTHWINLWILLGPMFFILMGHTSLVTNASTIAMSSAEDKANGSAVMNFMGIGIAVVMTFILSLFHNAGPVILPGIMLPSIIMIVILFWRANQQKNHSVEQ